METEKMKKNILIIDDSESIRELVSTGLENAGYSVIKGVDGQDGLEKLKEGKFEMIITDLNMPIMDGIQFVKEVRSLDEYKYLPIILLTTESQASKKQEAKEAGASGWIVKPFVEQKLLNVIRKFVR